MDRVRKARTPVRARVTRLCNQIQAEIDTGVPFKFTLEGLSEKLEAAQGRLKELDHLMIQAMLDAGAADADIEIEDDEAEDYMDRVRNAQRIVREAVHPLRDSEVASSSTSVGGVGKDHRTFKLPKVELKIFNVVAALQERFGKRELLQEVYVRELLGMVTQNAANPKGSISLSSMYDKLEAQLRALASLGISGSNMSVFLHPMIESSLPDNILLAWQRSSCYGKDGSTENPPKSKYDYLMEFIRLEVENEAKRTLVSSFDTHQSSVTEKRSSGGRVKNEIPTAASLAST
ncbi:unnamed protein product [Orchesella dallaii]|uniref:Uncharacterized protein n=1 Tax=Orchesella dallaii TaxID=48710 RepID=A0ABP1RW35_9HEXA